MRRLLTFIVALVAILVALMLWSRSRSTINTSPLAAVLRPDSTCPQPCWHGIRLGRTTLDEAEALLRNEPVSFTGLEWFEAQMRLGWIMPEGAGAYAYHWPNEPGRDVQLIGFRLAHEAHFRLADALALWGEPVGVTYDTCPNTSPSFLFVGFQGNVSVSVVFNIPAGTFPRITPDLPIATVDYRSVSLTYRSRWKGFRQIDSTMVTCPPP